MKRFNLKTNFKTFSIENVTWIASILKICITSNTKVNISIYTVYLLRNIYISLIYNTCFYLLYLDKLYSITENVI